MSKIKVCEYEYYNLKQEAQEVNNLREYVKKYDDILKEFLQISRISHNPPYYFAAIKAETARLEREAAKKAEHDKIEGILLQLLKDHKVKHV